MFTGIIEELGTVVALEPRGNLVRLRATADRVLEDARLGDSLAHNGVCLTLAQRDGRSYACDVMAETLARTTLGSLKPGEPVNLERAMGVGGRFGGHIVQGHVDAVGTVAAITREQAWVTFEIAAPESVLRYTVAQGSVALDGISLTVVERLPSGFTVSLIPHTLRVTTLGRRRVGDRVNLEADILAKYVAAAVGASGAAAGTPRGPMSLDWLAEQGYGPRGDG